MVVPTATALTAVGLATYKGIPRGMVQRAPWAPGTLEYFYRPAVSKPEPWKCPGENDLAARAESLSMARASNLYAPLVPKMRR